MEIVQYYQTKNPCYKAGKKIKPSGIVVHSTGANNPNLKRYVGPDDGILGHNANGNHWNNANANKCMHAFIGKVKDGSIKVYQTLPWDYRCWGVGSGSKGSYNATHIQFEICEDGLTDEKYYREVFQVAAELCAYLCKKYGISVSNVVGHYEAAEAGYGSNHADPRNWQRKHGGSMKKFREEVRAIIEGKVEQTTAKVPGKAASVEVKPQEEALTAYTVKKGDTLWKIAQKNLGKGGRYKEIMTASGLANDRLKVGQTLKIPKA
jgi:N-acetylmuramoyl-L-alanine amidase